jgi:hypothetical protein
MQLTKENIPDKITADHVVFSAPLFFCSSLIKAAVFQDALYYNLPAIKVSGLLPVQKIITE